MAASFTVLSLRSIHLICVKEETRFWKATPSELILRQTILQTFLLELQELQAECTSSIITVNWHRGDESRPSRVDVDGQCGRQPLQPGPLAHVLTLCLYMHSHNARSSWLATGKIQGRRHGQKADATNKTGQRPT